MFWRKKGSATPPEPGSGQAEEHPAGGAQAGPEPESSNPSTQFLTGDSEVDRRSVEVLLEAIARVSEGVRDLDELLVDIVDRSIEVTGAERGFLILAGEGDELCVRIARQRGGSAPGGDARFSTSVARRVLETQRPVRATVQSDSDALDLGRSVFDLKLRAVMCVPMNDRSESGDGTRGVLYVDSRAATREFNRRDLGLFAALSQHISIALEQARLTLESIEKARLENSLEVASAIQSGLMPRIPDDIEGFEVHGWYKPAERTSGDFFDFVRVKDGRLAVVVGDVSGHGIGPALVTATAQATLRSFMKVLPDVPSAVTMLNADLSERVEAGMFLTLLVMLLGPDGSVEWINAGHHAPLVWRASEGVVVELEAHSLALGYLEDHDYEIDARLELEPGDVLLAYTDGLIEAHPPENREELFGIERARTLLAEVAGRGAGAREITERLAEAALEFSRARHDDDITLVVCRRV